MGRIGPILGLVVLALTACTGPSKEPDRTDSPNSSPTQTQAPAADAWGVLSDSGCESDEFQSPKLPQGVTAWTALDDCRVVIAGDFGVRLVVSATVLTLADHLSGIAEVTGVAVNNDTVWVSGTSASPRGGVVVQRIDKTGAHSSRLPSRADFSTELVAHRRGVVVAVGNTAKREAQLLWLSDRRAKRIGPLPSELGLMALTPAFVVGTTSGLRPDYVFSGEFGDLAEGPHLPIRAGGGDTAAKDGVFAVGLNLLDSAGASNAADFYWSRDAGRTWRHSLIPNVTEVGSITVADSGDFFAFMTTNDGKTAIFRSTDGTDWTIVPTIELGENSADLASTRNSLWALTPGRLVRTGLAG